MQSPNLSKLIVWFIAISLVSSSALLAFSSYINGPGPAKPAVSTAISPLDKPFTDNLPAGTTDAEIAALQAGEKDNATVGLVNVLAQEIVAKNPGGPINQNGQSAILAPDDLNALVSNYIKNHSFSVDAIKSTVSDGDLKIVDSMDAASIDSYISKLNDIASNLNLSGSDTVDPTTTSDELASDLQSLKKTDNDLRNLQVPRQFASFHKSMVAVFDIVMNYTDVLNNDPVGGVALSDEYKQEVSKALVNMADEANNIQHSNAMLPKSGSLVQRILGIQTAYAFTFVDLVAWAQRIIMIYNQIKDRVEKYVEKYKAVILDFLKNTLLRKMTKQVVNWVAGGPEPQFVTNWNTFFIDASVDAAGHVLAQAAPQLCGYGGGGNNGPGSIDGLGDFAGFMKKVLTPINTAGIQTNGFGYPGCTLTDAIISINDFKQDFRNGGWKAYATILQPQNTLLGSLVTLSDRQLIAAGQAQAEASAKAVSGGGFTGQMACDDGSKPLTANDIQSLAAAGSANLTSQDQPGDCLDGSKPHITTPGVFSKDLSTQGFNAAYQRLVTAGDYKALIAYIADVALNRLFQGGAKGLLSYAHKQGNGSYSSGGSDSNAPPSSTAPPAEIAATDAKTLAQQILSRKQSTLADARSVVSSLGDTLTLLQQIVSDCSSNQAVVAGAKAEITALASLRTDLLVKIEALKPQVDGLQQFIANPTTVADLVALYGNLTSAQTEADDMSIQRQKADGVYEQAGNLYSSCSNDIITSTPPAAPPDPNATSTGTLP